MKPGGKEHPIDRVLHDGEEVKLGGTTLVAHLTPGHTRGCTTWTLKAQEGGKTYDVAIIGSFGTNPGTRLINNSLVPDIVNEYNRAFKTARSLKVDVPLGSHPGMYNMAAKHAKLVGRPSPVDSQSSSNPYIDPQGYKAEIDLVEATFKAVLEEQRKTAQ